MDNWKYWVFDSSNRPYVFSGFLIMLLVLPVALILVNQQQDNRSSASAADKLEIESGTLSSSGVSEQNDTNASNGKYVIFQNQTNSPTPTINPTGMIFYVSPSGSDSNPGTQTSPWKTIQKAANTLKAGETAILANGTYDETGVEFNTNSGTRTSPITIKAASKHQAILSSRSGCNPSMSISRSYVTIDGLRFKMSPNNPSCATPNSATVYIRCWQSILATPANPSTGTEGCTLRNALMDQDPTRYEAFKTNQDYSLVEHSEVPDIAAFNNKGTIFRNNIVRPTTSSLAIIGKGGVRDFQVYNNIVYVDSNHEGIILGGYSCCVYDTSGYEAFNSVAYNNVVISTSGTTDALTMYGTKDSGFYNNVVIGGYINFVKSYGDGNPQVPHNPTFKNNIIDCKGRSATAGETPTGTRTIDYNLFQNCTNVPAQNHPISGDPRFVNPASDWHLQPGSPGIGTGTAINPPPAYHGGTIELNKNFDGALRVIPWNLGMY